MADPLVTPAVVGAVVNLFFTEVIDAAKSAYRHKAKCRILLESVNKLQPHIDAASQNSANWDKAQSDGLEEIKDLLDKARSCARNGLEESKSEKRKRMMKVWRWGKLPSELMDIISRVEEAKQNVIFVAALENLAHMNALKETKSLDFVLQQTPSDIVGVDALFNKLKASIVASYAKDKLSYLGLHGRGGAGKTLLAQMLHNDKDIIEKCGAHSILWITVGLDARVSDLYKTMGIFLNDGVFEQKYAHRSLKDQRSYLWNAFAHKKVFLILDDVWQGQCDQDHEMMYWLNIATAPGSVTLITTRSSAVLPKVHAEAEVVLELSEENSWKLFCSHAFPSGTYPSNILEELAKDVCKECKGLPLALKVIGSAMLDKVTVEEWRSALYDLKRSKPISDSNVDVELYGRLRVSYNELKDDVTKICFLYFAAFPEDAKIPIQQLLQIWIAEGLFGTLDAQVANDKGKAHLEILVKRSLINWNRELEYVQVHDILRDLALYIIDIAEPGECAYGCFFHSGKVFKLFPTIKSLHEVKRMSFINSSISEWPEDLQVPHLRVCLLSGVIDIDTQISKYFNMMSLKYLDLSNNKFHSKRELSSFGGAMSLTNLDLQMCESIDELPESISELKSLMYLNLRGCGSLRELPKSIGELKSLIYLDLSWCGSLKELPESIGELKSLIYLDLSWCGSLKELPESIGELKSLTGLNLRNYGSLKELPESIGELKSLTALNLRNCGSLKELPESIGELKSLIYLDLSWCGSLKELPESIGELKSLIYLDLSRCGSLKELPESIGELKSLTGLNLRNCGSLKELPESIGELKSLTQLNIKDCGSLKELPESIDELKSLTQLNIKDCGSLKELLESINLKSLVHLD